MVHSVLFPVLFLLGLLLSSCAAPYSENVPYLLEQNYRGMSDRELIAYEQELSDEIVRSAQSPGGDVSLGVGFGSWGRHTGVGVGVGQRLDRRNKLERELWERRQAVRSEMRERGLLQEY